MTTLKWFKGNIHTHTNRSYDGDSDPEVVVRWYRRNGYDFLVLTDHNHRTLFEYQTGRRNFRRPLMIPGEEVSLWINNGLTSVHVGGIGIEGQVEPVDAGDVVATLQANVNAVREAGGIASINHPNHTWAFDHRQIVQVSGATFLEIFNGNPVMNIYGGAGHPSYDEIWDGVLSAGKPIFGVAVDDSHHFRGDFRPHLANPGRGWVMARTSRLTTEAVLSALERGDFYSSTGVTLEELETDSRAISLRIKQEWQFVYKCEFVGKHGRVLSQVHGIEATYSLRGDEGYVRAVVKASDGTRAWTQPVFLTSK